MHHQIKHLRLYLALWTSVLFFCGCVKEVEFNSSYEKKVVVNCSIHAIARPWRYRGEDYEYVDYYSRPERQYLKMYFSTQDGKKEYIPSATVKLFDNNTGNLLAIFERISDDEWQTDYLPEVTIIDKDNKQYSLCYRLEITDIPGFETITAIDSLERHINTKAIWRRNVQDYTEHGIDNAYYQEDYVKGPAWISVNSYACSGNSLSYGITGAIPVSCYEHIFSDYVNASAFNYNEAEKSYLYAIKVLDDCPKNKFFFWLDNNEAADILKKYDKDWCHSDLILKYVSQGYDRYLVSAITYSMRHSDKSNPLEHLYEDQIVSNIQGGLGYFGIEAILEISVYGEGDFYD